MDENKEVIAQELDEEKKAKIEAVFMQAGMHLSMSRAAFRDGYKPVGEYFERIAFEEAEYASRDLKIVGKKIDQ